MFEVVYKWDKPWARVFARRVELIKLGPYIEEYLFEDRWMSLRILSLSSYAYLHDVVYQFRDRGSETGTAGLGKERVWRDFVAMESKIFLESRGLMRMLLLPVVFGNRGGMSSNEFTRKFCQLIRISIRRIYIAVTIF